MTQLIILIFVAVAGLVAWRSYWAYRTNHLLANPPRMEVFEVRIPWGTTDTNKRMAKAWAKLAAELEASSQERQHGDRFIQLAQLVSYEEPHHTEPSLVTVIRCTPEQTKAAKRTIRTAFNGNVAFFNPSEDTLARLRDQLYPPEPEHAEYAAA